MPAGRVLVVMLVTLLTWTLLYAPELRRSAESHPEGLRRTLSLAVISPLAWVSDTIGLTSVTDAFAQGAGRDPEEEIGEGSIVDTLPTFDPPRRDEDPPEPAVRDTKIRVPTGNRRLRVVIVGDSLAVGVGIFGSRVVKPFFVDLRTRARISTGLARPDYFNWMDEMQGIVDTYRPDLTVVMIGENDNQNLLTPGGDLEQPIGTFDWASVYEGRVERFAKIGTSAGGHVMWIGLPTERDHARWDFRKRQNDIFEAVAARLPNVGFFDTWEAFDAPDGDYTAYYRDGDKVKLVRADDGIHFNPDGYAILMERALQQTTDEFDLHPKTYGE
jgi:hypothetical protein